ncbi:MAG: adenine deaminase C-terminal domain-containing protein, partial [Candidatus Kapaibacteriota bacterium]
GHCPNLLNDDLRKYISFGITTDHECTSRSEAEEKIQNGMKILIREGSAAKNFDELIPLIKKYPDQVMFCTDDIHPNDLLNGHINLLVKRANDYGFNLFKILRAVTLNPVLHYKLPVGLLRVGDDADFIVIKDLKDFEVIQTYIKGQLAYDEGKTLIETNESVKINNFNCSFKRPSDFEVQANGKSKIRVIEAIDGELLTNEYIAEVRIFEGLAIPDIEKDILKIAVVNRYLDTKPSVGFIKNFGLKNGALATSIAHDSHNIIVIGTTDEFISRAVNLIIQNKGGIAYVDNTEEWTLPLPIAGLMTNDSIENVSYKYQTIEEKVKLNGTTLKSPLMTLSFMSLLVIPHLKIGDKGLFNVDKFEFVDIFVD